jgi:hypothetical protein
MTYFFTFAPSHVGPRTLIPACHRGSSSPASPIGCCMGCERPVHAKRQPMLRSKHTTPKLAHDGRYDDGRVRYELGQTACAGAVAIDGGA